MSLWAFRFLLWYITIMIVQPQNRFLFLYPLRIANMSILLAIGLHIVSALTEKRPLVRMGPGTITALLLIVAAFASLYVGPMQINAAWNAYIDMLVKNALVLILIEAMVTTVERAWAVQGTLLLATLWWIKGGLRLAGAGMSHGGDRLFGPAVSLVVNPNAFAYMMCVFIPLYLYFQQQAPKGYVRWGFLGLALSAVYITLKTGSRTGFILLMVLAIVLIPKFGRRNKLAFTVGIAASLFLFTIAGALNVERFKTIPESVKAFFSGEERAVDELTQDEQSAQERRLKNRDAWLLIKDYPVFGVGINASDDLIVMDYPNAVGNVHCEILMAGRQMGFIGMGLYVSLVATLLLCARKIEKYCAGWWPPISLLGWALKMQCVMFIVGGIFSPIIWHPILLVLVGLSSGLWRTLKETMPIPATEGVAQGVVPVPA